MIEIGESALSLAEDRGWAVLKQQVARDRLIVMTQRLATIEYQPSVLPYASAHSNVRCNSPL